MTLEERKAFAEQAATANAAVDEEDGGDPMDKRRKRDALRKKTERSHSSSMGSASQSGLDAALSAAREEFTAIAERRKEEEQAEKEELLALRTKAFRDCGFEEADVPIDIRSSLFRTGDNPPELTWGCFGKGRRVMPATLTPASWRGSACAPHAPSPSST
jgi:hypothetical protein